MKRPNGTGSVVRLAGNRRRPYVVRVSCRDKHHHVIQKALSYHETQAKALEALDHYNLLVSASAAPPPDQLSVTVQQVFDGWSAREFRKINPPSVKSHKAAWNKRVSRYAGRIMRSVTLDEWQAILDEDEDEGRSQSLINNDASLIRALYRYAMKRDIVSKDYSQFLDVPIVDPKSKKGAFDDLHLKKLENLVADGFPWADTALILCYTGFRISEFLELTRFSYHPENGGYLQGGRKTRAGRDRIVPIHPKIWPYLQHWMDQNTDTIISREGQPVSAAWYREYAFAPIAEAIEIPEATPHWCRHTLATNLHAAGVDEITRKLILGHSLKSDITAHYTHPGIGFLHDAILRLA